MVYSACASEPEKKILWPTRPALGAFIGPFLFPEGEIAKVEQSAAAMGKLGKTSRGARSIAKKLGRALREGYKSAFHGSPATTGEAIRLIRDIHV